MSHFSSQPLQNFRDVTSASLMLRRRKFRFVLIDSAAAENEDDSEDESLGELSFLDETLGSAAVESAK